MAWDGLLVCMVQVLHVLQLFSHPGLPWLQTSCFFVSWRNAFLLSLIFSTLPLHSYSQALLYQPSRSTKCKKPCSWAPFKCIAGQKWQKPLVHPQTYRPRSVFSGLLQQRIRRLHLPSKQQAAQPSLPPEDITCTTMPDTTDTPLDEEKKLLIFRCCGHFFMLLSFQSVSSDNLTVGIARYWVKKPRAFFK